MNRVTYNNIHIENSHLIPKRKFERTLAKIQAENPDCLVFNRGYFSLKMEWATHNALYGLGLWRSRTKDVDLNYPQPFYLSALYIIFGMVSWIFLK